MGDPLEAREQHLRQVYAIFGDSSRSFQGQVDAILDRTRDLFDESATIRGERITPLSSDQLLERPAATGQVMEVGWCLRADGSRFPASVTVPARHEAGEFVGFTTITREEDRDARVGMMTAVTPVCDIVDRDFDCYLGEPVSREEIIETADELFARTEYAHELQALFSLASKIGALRFRNRSRNFARTSGISGSKRNSSGCRSRRSRHSRTSTA